ncbi:MAG TPA: AarF/UbiB family protein [Pirellulaceae bacterium]|nr:AarF/UbiB family protein [Pirellulaceae bacterium]
MLASLRRLASHADLARIGYTLKTSSDEQVRQLARRHLALRMGKMRGLPQKVGQMLSFSQPASNSADEFAPLLESAEPLAWEIIASELTAAWGQPWSNVIRQVDPIGHAASLGQVHEAVLHDGRHVAIKVQYPGIRDSVRTDLSLLGWLSAPLGGMRRGFDLAGYRETIMADLDHELDYLREAQAQRDFIAVSQDQSFVAIPAVIEPLCGRNVLVTQWESGETWETVAANWDEDARRVLGNQMVAWFLRSLFVDGLVHADLHPGNLRFRQTAKGPVLLLYDFGCVYRPTAVERFALLRLIQATIDHGENPWPLFMAIGFDAAYLEPLAVKLPALCQALFQPFLAPAVFDARDWNLSERVAQILGEDRWNFRIAGSPALLLLLRAFHGLKFYLEGLKTPVLWERTFSGIWQLTGNEALAMPLPAAPRDEAEFARLSRHLKIRVEEGGQTKVELTCPASAIDELDALIDADLLAKIQAQGNDLARLTADVRRRGYVPGPVFELVEADKAVRVWLE